MHRREGNPVHLPQDGVDREGALAEDQHHEDVHRPGLRESRGRPRETGKFKVRSLAFSSTSTCPECLLSRLPSAPESRSERGSALGGESPDLVGGVDQDGGKRPGKGGIFWDTFYVLSYPFIVP